MYKTMISFPKLYWLMSVTCTLSVIITFSDDFIMPPYLTEMYFIFY